MFDFVISGGTVVDGTGSPSYQADVAIQDGPIVEIGKVSGGSRQRIDADGALVCPGWVDIHTHYDGQVTWDDAIEPSASNGVTTLVMGNCSVGFAPVRPDHHDHLIDLMEGVEDIPGAALTAGMPWVRGRPSRTTWTCSASAATPWTSPRRSRTTRSAST